MWDEIGGFMAKMWRCGLLVGCRCDVGMCAGLARKGWVERDGADVCVMAGCGRKGVWALVCANGVACDSVGTGPNDWVRLLILVGGAVWMAA